MRLVNWFLAEVLLELRLVAGPGDTEIQPRAGNSSAVSPVGAAASRYRKATPQEILSNRLHALELGEKMREGIATSTHLVETEHFLIFSEWNRMNDGGLNKICEEMYEKLRTQFNLATTESVWIGKCPIYLFWEPAHFTQFISGVDQSKLLDPGTAHADGYHATRGRFAYIVINGVRNFGASRNEALQRLYEVLVHEGTHAFVNRYVSDRSLPLWLEEGLADYMAASLVPQSQANKKFADAARYGLKKPEAIASLLEKKKDLTSMEYGLAQSLVRCLVQQNSRTFIHFVELLKQGISQQQAFEDAYHVSRAELLRSWAQFWQRNLPRITS